LLNDICDNEPGSANDEDTTAPMATLSNVSYLSEGGLALVACTECSHIVLGGHPGPTTGQTLNQSTVLDESVGSCALVNC
jgi:hypothetical protein